MKNILFIPIDNRPITYSLTSQIALVNKSLNLLMIQVSEKMKEISNLWKVVHEKSVKYFEN